MWDIYGRGGNSGCSLCDDSESVSRQRGQRSETTHSHKKNKIKRDLRMVSRFSVPKGALVTSKNTRFRPLAAGTHQDVMQQI